MSSDSGLVLLSAEGATVGPATVRGGVDVVFPGDGIRWTWVLDARHEPYASLPIEKVLERARSVRKQYVLVQASHAASQGGASA